MNHLLRYIIFVLLTLQSTEFFGQKKTLVATTSMIADMARVVAGEEVEVLSLVPIGSDPHLFEAVPSDAEKLANADLVLRNGLTLEGWLDELINNSGSSAIVHTVTTGVDAIQSADYANAYDPHAWMSCRLAKKYVENISWALMDLIPESKENIRNRANAYLNELDALDSWIKAELQSIPLKHRILVTSHDAFRYYANDYGLKVVSVLGTSTEADVSIDDLNGMIRAIEEANLPAIFVESTINPKLMQQVANDKGIKIGGKLFADSLGDEESEASTYLKMMRYNTKQIVNGLTSPIGVGGLKKYEWGLLFLLIAAFISCVTFIAWLLSAKGVEVNKKVPQLSVKNVTTSYYKKTILSNINLEITAGKVYGVIGPNGSGKSTLIKSILGLVEKDVGEVVLNDSPLELNGGQLAYIPQKEEIDWDFPATVRDVVMMGLYPGKKVFSRLNAEDESKMKQALEELGISELINRQIGELSGGQQQRVFLARALCQEAEIYLLDEPLVGVDVITEDRIIKLLKSLAAKNKIIVMIHHDLSKVEAYFDEVIMINRRIIAAGPVKEVFIQKHIEKTYSGQLAILQKTDDLLS